MSINYPPISDANRKNLEGKQVILSLSGGKDSCATGIYLRSQGIPFYSVFMNTGWESPITTDYINNVLRPFFGEIVELNGKHGGMEQLTQKKGMFPSRNRRFCTQELKVRPVIRYFSKLLDDGIECVNAVGIRRAESEARSTFSEWEWCDGFDAETWRPILHWSEQDVIDCINDAGLPPNPLYLKGATRVGCWPCINARKAEINMIARQDPARIDQIRELERLVGDAAEARWQAKGEVLPSRPTFFQARTGGSGECWPIDKVVEWATQAGQFEMFDDPTPGCSRWGLCETNPE